MSRTTLNDHIIGSIDIELDLGSRVRVAQTQLSHVFLLRLEGLDKVGHVDSDTAANLLDDLTTGDFDTTLLLDGLKKFWVENTNSLALGQIRRQKSFHVIVNETFRNGVHVVEGVRGRGEGLEGDQLAGLTK